MPEIAAADRESCQMGFKSTFATVIMLWCKGTPGLPFAPARKQWTRLVVRNRRVNLIFRSRCRRVCHASSTAIWIQEISIYISMVTSIRTQEITVQRKRWANTPRLWCGPNPIVCVDRIFWVLKGEHSDTPPVNPQRLGQWVVKLSFVHTS